MAQPKLTLYLDVVSPFAYLAFHFIQNSPAFKSVAVTYIPIFLGGVMKATNNRPPITIKNKAQWINKERLRWAKNANIPIAAQSPEGFPPNTIAPMRALAALELADATKLPSAFEELYKSFWVERKPVQEADVYEPALKRAVGDELAGKVLAEIGSAEVKQRLTENTEKAIKDGAFGLPWMVATNAEGKTEGYWGFDHLGQVMDHLGLKREEALRAML
ncbi:putative 2-hydroxychromene-2-carboxylate isomerase [Myriangium duriaei CBS 260.36]|uniref:Glutathione S-transferase kappa n=1 Tax=Myriangium duriaei CBS 260.36 TaxID=1168546 RepID=A0A9P4ME32_9PEZI|nr:putative 2-hydroxychromene-2-carboxylate isomerase [Myriangium duriaei CBS 260.36]